MLDLLLRFLGIGAGLALVVSALFSATRTLVLPRSAQDPLVRLLFGNLRRLFLLRLVWARDYLERDRVMAFYAPVGLLALVPTWCLYILAGYTLVYRSIGIPSWGEAFRLSGSSFFTLGFVSNDSLLISMLMFSEAGFGLMVVAILIAYLPTMYSAFSRREIAVSLLEVRAGNPPSAVGMIKRYHRIHGLEQISELWGSWETRFADIQESHTSLPALNFFRSPLPEHSWVNASGAVLDTAAIILAAIDIPTDPKASLCLRAGFICLRRIAGYFNIPYDPNPLPTDPISVTRAEFEQALDEIAAAGIPLKADRAQAWRDFAGWRVNYDAALLGLAGLTMAPTSPWCGDRADLNRR